MERLTALARMMLGTGLRILVGTLLAIFLLAYALGGVILLPLVALVLALAALPGRLRAAGRQFRPAARLLSRAAGTAAVHARGALGWWLTLGR